MIITKEQARDALHAFTWCDSEEFLRCMKMYGGVRPQFTSYMREQFEMMQQKPLDFIIKWSEVAQYIILSYIAKNE